MLLFSKKLCANIVCQDVHAKILFQFFDILEYVFRYRVHLLPWAEIDIRS
jgi:hypothetical protein